MLRVHLTGELGRLEKGLELLLPDLPLALSKEGAPLQAVRGDCLRVEFGPAGGSITYAEPAQFYRALSLLCQHAQETELHLEEKPCFRSTGVLFDVSRNAVLKPETLRYFFRKMALMGLNLGMLYTEDTYAVADEPYFGYLRGRYSQQELRELDDYADALGIELIPCIQTLGHLERMLHWEAYGEVKDTAEVLLVDEEKTYQLLDRLIAAAGAPFRSRRIHVGMDEAHDLGLGAYLKKNGYRSGYELMKRHLARISQILKKYDRQPMMWSDMYFRLASPTGSYYDVEGPIPQEAIDAAPEEFQLVYWDYYNRDPAVYEKMLREHKRFAAPTVFAGGLRSSGGPAANYDVVLGTTLPALQKCVEWGVQEVLATAWGDDGAETNLLAVLYGMQVYAEFMYAGHYSEETCRARFLQCVGAPPQAFLDFALFDAVPCVSPGNPRASNPSKYLLYEDPLVPLFLEDTGSDSLADYYAALSKRYGEYRKCAGELSLLFECYEKLGRVLSLKCAWREKAAAAVRGKDRKAAQTLADSIPKIIAAVQEQKDVWRRLWFFTNKPYGFEILDGRLGWLVSRLETARWRMESFACGETDTIEELAEERLPYFPYHNGEPGRCDFWHKIVSSCRV